GLLIAAFGVGPAFAINAPSFVAVLVGLLLMDTSRFVTFARQEQLPTLLGGLREGVSYARETPHVRLVLTMLVAISTIAMNFNVLLPVLARHTLESGPGVFGLVAACFGAGALVGGLLSAALSRASWKAIVAGPRGHGAGGPSGSAAAPTSARRTSLKSAFAAPFYLGLTSIPTNSDVPGDNENMTKRGLWIVALACAALLATTAVAARTPVKQQVPPSVATYLLGAKMIRGE